MAPSTAKTVLAQPTGRSADATRDELVASIRLPRGNVYRTHGQRDEALAEYTDALRAWPNHSRGYVNRGWPHEKHGQVELARADYQQAAALKPPDDWLTRALDRTR
jgi:Tfp pilus assembly protein PilF